MLGLDQGASCVQLISTPSVRGGEAASQTS